MRIKYYFADQFGEPDSHGIKYKDRFYSVPRESRNKKLHKLVISGERVFMDGFEWTDGGWRRNLRALAERLF